MKKVKQAHGGALIRLEKGETNNPNGRPRKWVSTLREQGYKLSEVNDALQVITAMDLDEVQRIADDVSCTILERTVAAALIKSFNSKSLFNLETLLTRVYGKPKETQEQKITGSVVNKVELVIVNSKGGNAIQESNP